MGSTLSASTRGWHPNPPARSARSTSSLSLGLAWRRCPQWLFLWSRLPEPEKYRRQPAHVRASWVVRVAGAGRGDRDHSEH
jgi:hypothetical protein